MAAGSRSRPTAWPGDQLLRWIVPVVFVPTTVRRASLGRLAKWRGAEVVGTASANHLAFLEQLCADEVLDYAAVPSSAKCEMSTW